MANLFEIEVNENGTGTDLYNYVRYGGWFNAADDHMKESVSMPEYIEILKGVLVNGKRTILGYIVEHDWLGNIISATNNGSSIDIYDFDSYKQFVTVLKSEYGETYTFYCFSDLSMSEPDPFGYESETLRQQIGDAYYDFESGELVNGSN